MNVKTTLLSCAAALETLLSNAAVTNYVQMTPLTTFAAGTNATLAAANAYTDAATNAALSAANAHTDAATNATLSTAKDYTDAAIQSAGSVTPQVVTNIVDAKIAAIPKDGVSTNAVSGIVTNHVESGYLATPSVTNGLVTASITNGLASAASVSSLESGVSGLSSDVSSLSSSVTAISGHLNAEDAHFVSTNYDSTVNLPEAYVEVKINGTWLTIWKEMRRWTKFVGSAFSWDTWGGFYDWGTNVTAQLSSLASTKADRCWGIYDSETGGYSPEGYTQISSSNILIAANMAYQRTVTSDGAVWVLRCNTGYATVGGDTNGFFRILDGDGNVQFEIVKGNKRELGADADGISVDNSTTPPTCTITYSVIAAAHPKIYVCNDLTTAGWKDEDDSDCVASVTWTGTSGAYVASVQAKTSPAPKLFVKATYETGGETYIRNVAPVGMTSIYLNGTKYYLGTATIDGNTVLTLSTTAP